MEIREQAENFTKKHGKHNQHQINTIAEEGKSEEGSDRQEDPRLKPLNVPSFDRRQRRMNNLELATQEDLGNEEEEQPQPYGLEDDEEEVNNNMPKQQPM